MLTCKTRFSFFPRQSAFLAHIPNLHHPLPLFVFSNFLWCPFCYSLIFFPCVSLPQSFTEADCEFMTLGWRWKHRAAAINDMAEMSMEDATSPTPLTSIVEAFEKLAKILESQQQEGDLHLDTFCQACSLVSILFSCLGLAFKFAEMEYVSKVETLLQAAKTYDTLENTLDFDVANDTVKSPGSRSRNLRRVRQGLDLIRAIFENFLATNDDSLKEAASTAYAQVCAPYHTWAVRTAVAAGMYALPSRDQLLINLKETHQSAEIKMKQYIRAALPVIQYIDNLYLSRNIVLDW